jgi:hypothetical protein
MRFVFRVLGFGDLFWGKEEGISLANTLSDALWDYGKGFYRR